VLGRGDLQPPGHREQQPVADLLAVGLVDLVEAVFLEDPPQPLLAVQIGLGIALLATEVLGPFDERNEQAERLRVALQADHELPEPP